MNEAEFKEQLEEFLYDGNEKGLEKLLKSYPEEWNAHRNSHSFKMNFVRGVVRFEESIIGVLIENGVELNAHDCEGFASGGAYALGSCIRKNNYSRAKFLMDLGADPNICNGLNSVSYMRASQEDLIKMAGLLLQYGADINLELEKMPGYTPVVRAMEYGHDDFVKFLISKGAKSPDLQLDEPDIEPFTNFDEFANSLEVAIESCIKKTKTRYPKEHFCMLGIETNSDFNKIALLLDSVGAIQRDESNRLESDSVVGRISLDCDSEHYGVFKEEFEELNERLYDWDSGSIGTKHSRQFIKSVTQVFQQLEKKRVLESITKNRQEFILIFSIIDADEKEWETCMKVIKKINPKSVFQAFKNSLS